MSTTIQDVGEKLGIKRGETDKILVEIRANQAVLDSCNHPHDFSVCLDRYTKQPIENPSPAQHFGAKWGCSKCKGVVDNSAKHWYNLALKHAAK